LNSTSVFLQEIDFAGKKPHTFKLSLTFFFLLLSCEAQHAPIPDISAMAAGFINPSQNFADLIESSCISSAQLDSCLYIAKKASVGSLGAFSETLKDSSGVEYTLGWETPSILQQDSTYPLIIYLHGGTGTTINTKGEKAYDMLQPLADTFSLFLASPSSNRFTPWWSPQGINRILQTLRFMTMHYPINPQKVFLAGVSDGATGCYAAANTVWSPFAGFIAVSGFGGMLQQVGMPLAPSNLMQRPIYNVNAGHDHIYDISQVMTFLDWLKTSGVHIDHKEYPEEQHGFDYRAKEFATLAGYVRTWSKPREFKSLKGTAIPGFPMSADNIVECVRDISSQTSRVSGNWDHDTLRVYAEGIREIVAAFPGIDKKEIFVSRNHAKPRKTSAVMPSALLTYRQMIHSGFPRAQPLPCYRITF